MKICQVFSSFSSFNLYSISAQSFFIYMDLLKVLESITAVGALLLCYEHGWTSLQRQLGVNAFDLIWTANWNSMII